MLSNSSGVLQRTGGRPRKEDGKDEKKRDRMRRSQQAFRIRRQAAENARDERLLALETTMDKMTSLFVDFADVVLQSQRLQSDPSVLHKLQTTLATFTSLARSAADGSAVHDGATPGDDDLSITSPESNIAQPATTANILLNNTPTSLSNVSVFGNGWTDQVPKPFLQHVNLHHRPTPVNHQISVRLLQRTLNYAYDALSGGLPSEVALRIFGLTRARRDKQELFFNLRWFLGPGYHEMYRLGDAFLMNAPTTKMWTPHSATLWTDSHPYRTVPRSNNASGESENAGGNEKTFMNAFDVERYFQQMGARYLDLDTMELPSHNFAQQDEEQVSNGIMLAEESSSSKQTTTRPHAADRRDDPKNPDTESNSWFLNTAQRDFDSSLDESGFEESTSLGSEFRSKSNNVSVLSSAVGSSSSRPVGRRRVRISSLLDQLAYISVCLENGPGYARAQIEQAIALSAVVW
ncbi:hypothetical protein DM02DRAFT_724311 [Periconia macrospinosa]|uniref:BZIP domain-containing protein n=1 Tax=Periconia macrospinosa TaxID=97972 RepID=A0A2V1E9C6_9PLEO|nr:hypothetical protein DM02DRAFT_724311 [Periconia macrospinosa]